MKDYKKAIVVTGALGGIGSALCKVLSAQGYIVVGTDIKAHFPIAHCEFTLQIDLNKLVGDEAYRSQKFKEFQSLPVKYFALINNAATQLLNSFENIGKEWQESLNVNLTAPMLLSQFFLDYLQSVEGSIVNISSIHNILTKPRFVSYATSKSALVGLTKAMAVDLAGKVRVNCISPAAIETEMLKAGFNNDLLAMDKLYKLHPVQRIGYPEEVAKLALFLISDEAKFINGANLQLDGGISSVLHDL